MSRLIEHAKKEFELAGWIENNEAMQNMAMENILELMEVFSKQGHSGMSAPYILNLFNSLAKFEFIGNLTGKDEEWNEVEEGTFQNKRYSSVFKKGKEGQAYNIDAKIFSDDNGETWFTNKDSRGDVNFPCTMEDLKKEYIKIARQ